MRVLAVALLAVGCAGPSFAAGTEPSLLGEGGAGAVGDPTEAGAGGEVQGAGAPNVVAGAPAAGGGGSGTGGPSSPVGGSSVGGGGASGTGGGNDASGAGGAVAGQPATGGTAGSSGGTAGSGGSSTAQDRCTLPDDGPGSICGGACGFDADNLPKGYGYPSADGGMCGCTPRTIGYGTWIDVRGDGEACVPSNLNDTWARAKYELNDATCVRITVPWNHWAMRVFTPTDATGKLFAKCALVPGVDPVGNLPPVRVEVFGEGDAWIQVEQVPCDFGAIARSCK